MEGEENNKTEKDKLFCMSNTLDMEYEHTSEVTDDLSQPLNDNSVGITNEPVTDDDKLKQKDTQSEENPFSFKRFLNRTTDQNEASAPNAIPASSYNHRSGGNTELHYTPTTTFSEHLPQQNHTPPLDTTNLPDFVQDFYPNDAPNVDSPRVRPQSDMPLPDFALDTDVAQHNNGTGARPKHSTSSPSELQDSDFLPTVNDSGGQAALPDFLFDFNRLHLCQESSSSSPDDVDLSLASTSIESPEGSSDSDSIKKENSELKKQLKYYVKLSTTQAKRAEKLLTHMEMNKRKEREETAAMEQMMFNVENNLQDTTKRAVQAEKEVVKLKERVAALEAELIVCHSEPSDHPAPQSDAYAMKQKALYASKQLNHAATSAQQTLRQLMTGVEEIKMISNVLASIDKFQENSKLPPDCQGAEGGS